MRAGSLRAHVTLWGYRETQTPSGFVARELVKLKSTRAHIVRHAYRYRTSGIRSKEEFDAFGIQVHLRFDKRIQQAEVLKYLGDTFAITMREMHPEDNSIVFHCERMDAPQGL